MKKTVCMFLVCTTLAAAAPVSVTKVITADLTNTGSVDTIFYTVTAKKWNQPVTWSLTVKTGTETVFRLTRDDTPYEDYFKKQLNKYRKREFIALKQKYYLEQLPHSLLKNGPPVIKAQTEPIFDKGYSGSIYFILNLYYVYHLGQSNGQAYKLAEDLAATLKSDKFLLLEVPRNPRVKDGKLMVYDKNLKKFIPFLEI